MKKNIGYAVYPDDATDNSRRWFPSPVWRCLKASPPIIKSAVRYQVLRSQAIT
ncbi:MAG: hypothetical protein MZU97_04955 [Bacillus subtilis]|nr:hypothetical protein [Bacillus subtilis]